MNQNILDALNNQIRLEFNAAFLYLSFSVDMKDIGLSGMAHWLRQQYREECGHALRLVSYLEKRKAKVIVPEVSRPVCDCKSPLDVFHRALEHERMVSESIDALVALSLEAKDYATHSLLLHYVDEQVEEENSVQEIVEMLELCRHSSNAVLRIDSQLASRATKDCDIWD